MGRIWITQLKNGPLVQWYVEMAFELEKWLSLTTTTATHTDYRVRMRKSATIVNNLTTVMVLLILAYKVGQS